MICTAYARKAYDIEQHVTFGCQTMPNNIFWVQEHQESRKILKGSKTALQYLLQLACHTIRHRGWADLLASAPVQHGYAFQGGTRNIGPSLHCCFEDDLTCCCVTTVESYLKGRELLVS